MTTTHSMCERVVAMKDREETIAVLKTLCGEPQKDVTHLPSFDESSVYGEGPLLLSNIPDSCRRGGVVLGIDEAGRGSVIGPMVYGMSFWSTDVEANAIPKDFNDSKQLNEGQRNRLFDLILQSSDIGFCTRILPASEISRNMLRPVPYNLNQMSHDAAMAMIRALRQAHVTIHTCYIDTVGNAASYQRRLEAEFPGMEFVVESKADDKYPPCSAASIGTCLVFSVFAIPLLHFLTLCSHFYALLVAKVIRDRIISNWRFTESQLNTSHKTNFGSGYPSDPICKEWIEQHQEKDPIFAFPDAVRFSWGPIKKLLSSTDSSRIMVSFAADENDGDDTDGETHKVRLGVKRQQAQMSAFLGRQKATEVPPKRSPFFEKRKLQPVINL